MKRIKIKKRGIIVLFIFLISFIGLLYSIINIVKWCLENYKSNKINNEIKDNINIEENIDNSKSILDNFNIDFENLRNLNSDAVGYLKVENTSIDSIIVKSSNNSYYLNHSFDKKYNSAGWIFADYKNKYDGTDKNYVVYGHARKDGSMFGTLKNVLSKDWQDTNSKIIFITQNSKSIYEVFSVYKIIAEEYYITTDFKSDDEFETFINKVKSRSLKDFNVEVTTNDRLLTLSTCDDNNNQYRIVLHAKIVEQKAN